MICLIINVYYNSEVCLGSNSGKTSVSFFAYRSPVTCDNAVFTINLKSFNDTLKCGLSK